MANNLKVLDLFAGAGGLSEGFIQAGFEPVAYVEADRAACFTLKTRVAYHWLKQHNQEDVYRAYLQGRISRSQLYGIVPARVLDKVINETISKTTLPSIFEQIDFLRGESAIDVIIGGPPCQAYSLVGRGQIDKNDPRNYLYLYYAAFLERYKPKYFVFENVMGLLSAKDAYGNSYLEQMREMFKSVGYRTEYQILSADDYGVLQQRKRVILVGRHGDSGDFYPEVEKWKPENVTVNEVLQDLPPIRAGEGNIAPVPLESYNGTYLRDAGIRNGYDSITWHQARPHMAQDLEIYRIAVELWNNQQSRLEYDSLPESLKSHRHRNSFIDRFKVVAGNHPYSHTVLAHIAKDGHYYIHPDIRQNRSLSPREAARLQSFPDDYYFESVAETPAKTSAFRQIGNAVPVLLARKIAEALVKRWDG